MLSIRSSSKAFSSLRILNQNIYRHTSFHASSSSSSSPVFAVLRKNTNPYSIIRQPGFSSSFSTSASSSSSSSSATATAAAAGAAKKKWSKLGMGAFTLLLGGGSALAIREYLIFQQKIKERKSAEMVIPLNPPLKFAHPLDDSPWYWRTYVAAKRLVYLFFVFAPCVAAAMVMQVRPESSTLRQFWLDLLVSAFEKAGCSFQKFGQWISMRPDMFSPDVVDALSKLRSDIEIHTYAHTRKMIKESFGKDLEELFETFDPEPIASGTIAQVHRATLKPEYAVKGINGEMIRDVAVKVRHPQVIDETWLDLDIIFKVADLSNVLSVPFSKEEFLDCLQKQVDLKWEAYNMMCFARNFQQEISAGVVNFPHVITDLLSSSVLVESWAPGQTVSNILDEVGLGFKQIGNVVDRFTDSLREKKKQLAWTVYDVNMKMFLRDNLLHGDMHAGNVLYDENGKCTVLDAGLTASLSPDIRHRFGEFLRALCTGDSNGVAERLVALTVQNEQSDFEGFNKELGGIMNKWIVAGKSVAPDGGVVNLGDLMGEICFSMQRHKIALRGEVATAIMTMSINEGLIRSLDPDFDIVGNSLSYFIRFGRKVQTPQQQQQALASL